MPSSRKIGRPEIDWRTCPGYQQHLLKSEQERKHEPETILGKEEKGEITKYSFGEEELDPPEREGRNATAANQGGK